MKYTILLFHFLLITACYSQGDITATYRVNLYLITENESGGVKLDSLNSQEVQLFLDDSAFYVTKGLQRTAYDFSKEKIYFLNLGNRTYDETSIYAEIDYRTSEFYNRLQLKDFLGSEGIESQIGSIFDLETLFGLEVKTDSIAQYIQYIEGENEQQFFIKNETVTSVDYTNLSLSEKLNSFHKFLLYEFQLHPYISRKIISQRKLPSDLSFRFLNSGKRYQVRYKLIKFNDNASVAELNNNYFIYGFEAKDKLLTALNKVYGFVHNQKVEFKSVDDLKKEFHAHVKRKKYVDAFLILMESKLSQNENLKSEFDLLREKAIKDRDFQSLITLLKKPENEEENLSKIISYEKLKKRKYEKSWLIDAFLANLYSSIDEKDKAFEMIHNVMIHNPYITSVYCDLGDLFAEQHNMRLAWKAYEIALKIEPTHPMVYKIHYRKKFLKQNFRDYFF